MITAQQLVQMMLIAEVDEFGNVDVKGDPSRGTVWHGIGEPKGGVIPGKWGNLKIGKGVYVLGDTPAGICPGAKACKARFMKRPGEKGHIVDFPGQEYRCYSAMDERWPETAEQRWKNFNILRGRQPDEIAEIVLRSIPPDASIVRVKEGGDFMTQNEFDGWLLATKSAPEVLFYAYTKSLPFWVRRLGEIPENFKLIASYGGKWDNLIEEHNLRHVRVVADEAEAQKWGLPISSAWDDKTAYTTDKSFAILTHGSQPAGTEVSKKTMRRSKELAKIRPKSRMDFPDVQKRLADLRAMAHPTTLEALKTPTEMGIERAVKQHKGWDFLRKYEKKWRKELERSAEGGTGTRDLGYMTKRKRKLLKTQEAVGGVSLAGHWLADEESEEEGGSLVQSRIDALDAELAPDAEQGV